MRVSESEKAKSHARIVTSAARLARERGLAGASVGEVMRDAGLTHGGFYRHFSDKEAMLAAALEAAFAEILELLAPREGESAAEAAVRFGARYVSAGHVANPGIGCPIPSIGAEIGRETEALKPAFGAGVRAITARLAEGMGVDEAAATRRLAMMAGAVLMARASDAETAGKVLAACAEG